MNIRGAGIEETYIHPKRYMSYRISLIHSGQLIKSIYKKWKSKQRRYDLHIIFWRTTSHRGGQFAMHCC